MNNKHKIIAVEEHFMHPSLSNHLGHAAQQPDQIKERLFDFSDIRISEMDSAGIDVQILSHQSPGSQRLKNEVAIDACKNVNNALAQVISNHSDRFLGFAMLPTNLPIDAASELRRSVEELGFKGAMIHGLSAGKMVDEKFFWPIFAEAERLDVPIYLHPALPDKEVTERYYAPYDASHPMLTRAAWGFGVEAGTQAIRMILSGVFDKHPNLKIILGHLGEAIPFWLPRIQESLSRTESQPINFEDIFKSNFWITTSGFFSDHALELCVNTLKLDHILFAIDWPYANNETGVNWLQNSKIKSSIKSDIFSENAKILFRL
ncbi:amidohydrolase family protein [Paracoccaceae bacterium]|nr:amidohydrolase family protein [Paracoccaceae bacterium]